MAKNWKPKTHAKSVIHERLPKVPFRELAACGHWVPVRTMGEDVDCKNCLVSLRINARIIGAKKNEQ